MTQTLYAHINKIKIKKKKASSRSYGRRISGLEDKVGLGEKSDEDK
jgi:hypothetical protein